MFRLLAIRFRRRRAISTLIGGLIVLTLLLSALAMTVFVSQQFSQYQQIVNRMFQYRNRQQLSEELVVNSPGMVYNPSWSGCGGCNMYNMSLSNVGSVGIQIATIYINSTGSAGSGCSSPNPQPCILGPASTATSTSSPAFSKANAFLNPGELYHFLLVWLPSSNPNIVLPSPTPAFPENAITLITGRGNVFTFQWPFQPQTFGQSQSAFSSGNMKVAYQGTYDSKNEPGVASASGGTVPSNSGYCHNENATSYPAAAGYAEELTGISGVTDTDKQGHTGVLWFLNPWITTTTSSSSSVKEVMESAVAGATTVYIYVVVVNNGNTAYSPTAGTIDLTWFGSNHIDGYLVGVYYNGKFYATSPSIAPGASYYAIFKITIFTVGCWPGSSGGSCGTTTVPASSFMFWGAASLTDAPGSSAEGQNYFAGTILVSGLWVRIEPSSGSCA